tara:strand:+ start:62187 stop:62699 length:513 start_codon:yes stop_codon:yes gene_type:complete
MELPYVEKSNLEKFRQGVAVVLRQPETNKIFFALRSDEEEEGAWVTDDNGEWVMPQGGLDLGEEPKGALLRELKEETGISPEHVRFESELSDVLAYKFEPLIEPATWIGQAHKWYLCTFTGNCESDINLSHSSPAEFAKYEWKTVEEIVGRAQPQQKAVYIEVFKRFGLL